MKRLTRRQCDVIARAIAAEIGLSLQPALDSVAVARMTEGDIVVQAAVRGRTAGVSVPWAELEYAAGVHDLRSTWQAVAAELAERLGLGVGDGLNEQPHGGVNGPDNTGGPEAPSRLDRLLGPDLFTDAS